MMTGSRYKEKIFKNRISYRKSLLVVLLSLVLFFVIIRANTCVKNFRMIKIKTMGEEVMTI